MMKFLIFSDLHHGPGSFMGGTEEDLHFFHRRAKENGCDFIIHAGDFCHGTADIKEPYLNIYRDTDIPVYHVMGNHDTDETTLEETLRLYQMPAPYYFFDCKGVRFICLDPNYLLEDGQYVHYELQNYFGKRDAQDYLPPEQLTWLEETLVSSPHPCIIISHASFDRLPDGVKNQHEVRSLISRLQKEQKCHVLMMINGHYHTDHLHILDNTLYLELNSASFDWLPQTHDCYPEELCKKIRYLNHILVYNQPLCAVITVDGKSISIQGMEGDYFMGISRKDTPNPCRDAAGREMVPRILDARITLL